jgi:large conductance mechanosensitive channel
MQPPRLPLRRPQWMQEFQAFIMRGSVVDLAVGIIIGAAFTAIVNSLVKDILNPAIRLALGGIDFSNVFLILRGASQPTLAAAQTAGAVTPNIGVIPNTVIQFLIVALVVFWIVRALNTLYRKPKPAPEVAPPPRQEVLPEEIRGLLAGNRTV